MAALPLACGGGGSAAEESASTSVAERSSEEVDAAMVRCLQDAGYSARLSDAPDGGVEWESADEDAQAEVTYQACIDSLVDDGVLAPPEVLSDAELEDLYDHEVDLVACLEDEGYAMPSPPSREAFVESRGEWRAYLVLPDVSNEEFERLNVVCPQQ